MFCNVKDINDHILSFLFHPHAEPHQYRWWYKLRAVCREWKEITENTIERPRISFSMIFVNQKKYARHTHKHDGWIDFDPFSSMEEVFIILFWHTLGLSLVNAYKELQFRSPDNNDYIKEQCIEFLLESIKKESCLLPVIRKMFSRKSLELAFDHEFKLNHWKPSTTMSSCYYALMQRDPSGNNEMMMMTKKQTILLNMILSHPSFKNRPELKALLKFSKSLGNWTIWLRQLTVEIEKACDENSIHFPRKSELKGYIF